MAENSERTREDIRRDDVLDAAYRLHKSLPADYEKSYNKTISIMSLSHLSHLTEASTEGHATEITHSLGKQEFEILASVAGFLRELEGFMKE